MPPLATVSAAASINQDGATLNGKVTPNGLATQGWFEYGTDASLSTYTSTAMHSIGDGLGEVAIVQIVSGCTNGTVYYFRVCGSNSKGTTRSAITSFTTSFPGASPTVSTLAASSISANSAILNGNVTPNGLSTTAWFEYGTDPSLVASSSTSTQAMGSGTTSVPVSAVQTGLFTGTTYYYRVVASNGSGTSKGSIASFTPGAVPAVTTLAATSVGATTATLNGNVIANGLSTTAWFEYGTDPSLVASSSTSTQAIGSGTTSQLVGAALTGLSTGTTYYYRMIASNGSGTSKGGIASFTPGAAPTVNTLAASSVAETSATLNGTVTPNGLATTAWFEWGTDAALATYSKTPAQSVGSGTTTIPVNTLLSGLTTGKTCFYRIAASNSTNTSKGPILFFTPIHPQPDPGVADIRQEFLDAVNQARSVARTCGSTPFTAVSPVSWNDDLAMAAYLHSFDMATNGFFSHTGSDNSSPGLRITREGYAWSTYGENIAVGYPTVSAVIQGWLGSEGHCRNIMNPAFEEIGAGYAEGVFGGSTSARYWTFDLASPR